MLDECCAVFNYALKDGMKSFLCLGRIIAIHDSEVEVKWNGDKTTDTCPPGNVHATEGAAFAAFLDRLGFLPAPSPYPIGTALLRPQKGCNPKPLAQPLIRRRLESYETQGRMGLLPLR